MNDERSLLDQFNVFLHFLQANDFRVVIVEGPRGCGKTTFCQRLLTMTDLTYYKTWGREQKLVRHEMSSKFNLDLPQGTYFALDLLAQVKTVTPVLVDRGNISAIAYQRELPYGQNRELHKYYVGLMKQAHAVLVVLQGTTNGIVQRRVSRGEDDEQKLYKTPEHAHRIVEVDVSAYEESIDKMIDAGLKEVLTIDLAEGFWCECYIPSSVELIYKPEVTT